MYLAETCLTLTVLHTLAAFDVRPTATGPTPQLTPTSRTSISNAKGEYSATAARDITREVEYTTGLVRYASWNVFGAIVVTMVLTSVLDLIVTLCHSR